MQFMGSEPDGMEPIFDMKTVHASDEARVVTHKVCENSYLTLRHDIFYGIML